MKTFPILKNDNWHRELPSLSMHRAVFVAVSAAFCFMLRPLPVHAQQIIYVAAVATGTSDGSSWDDAFPFLQDALAEAQAGDEIWVAAGTYYPDQGANFTSGDREARFDLVNGVRLYGGFAGTESTLEERDYEENLTILSGDLLQNDNENVHTAEPTRGDNSYNVVGVSNSVTASTILDGFVITSGNANDTVTFRNGGGLSIIQGSPTIKNTTIVSNSALSGGGMLISSSSPLVTNTFFDNNMASDFGGGVLNFRGSPTFVHVIFSKNMSGGFGGAMYNNRGHSFVTNTIFQLNQSSLLGGAVYNRLEAAFFANVTFVGNASNGFDGGGMYNDESSSTLVNAVFSGNIALYNGGGMYNSLSNPAIINATFSENVASEEGGGVYNFDSNPMISNSILWGNSAGVSGNQVKNDETSSALVSYCIIADGLAEGMIDGGANVDDDPHFVDADGDDNIIGTADDDVRLLFSSPAIDAGDNTALTSDSLDLDKDLIVDEPFPVDHDFHLRVFDGGTGSNIVDIGAYEFGAPPVSTAIELDKYDKMDSEFVSMPYPNPFYDYTRINISVSEPLYIQIELFDLLGRSVLTIHKGWLQAGYSQPFLISGVNITSGVYFVRIFSKQGSLTRKVTVIR